MPLAIAKPGLDAHFYGTCLGLGRYVLSEAGAQAGAHKDCGGARLDDGAAIEK